MKRQPKTKKGRRVPGACLCKKIQFSVGLPSKFLVHCHCSLCRHVSGGPFMTWTGVPESTLKFKKGGRALKTYRSSRSGRRQFCGHCGTHLFFRAKRWPGEVHVTVPSLKGRLDRKPHAHVFFSDRARWFKFRDQLRKYGGKTGLKRLK